MHKIKLMKVINKKINFYENNGFVIFKNIIPKKIIYNFKRDIYFCSKKLYFKYSNNKICKIINFSPYNFDKYLLLAKKENLDVVTKSVYDLSKKINSLYQIAVLPKVQTLIKKIMGTNASAILDKGMGVRIDYPGDKYYKARLHTDYHSQLGSQNGLVMYVPIHKIIKKMGPVILFSKSHLSGVHDCMVDLEKVKKGLTNDPYFIEITKKKLNTYKKKNLYINEGDIALFNMNLLHESGNNITKDKIRWSLIVRYFDLNCPTALEIDFKGGQQSGNIYSFKNGNIDKVYKLT